MSKTRRLAVLGAGGHGHVVAEAAEYAGWDEIVFFDDAPGASHRISFGSFGGNSEDLFSGARGFDGVAIGIGDNRMRSGFAQRAMSLGLPLPVITHPAASVSRRAELAAGTVVLAGAVVVTGARVGAVCIVNTGASVDHDCIVGDWVHISPGARLGGAARIDDMVWIGIGAIVREGITVGADSIVGAGATVVRNVKAGETVVGTPARPIIR